jgi:hypothetical protein
MRLAICAHETHCQPHQLGLKGPLLSPWQRYTVGAVVQQADVVLTSIPKYARQMLYDYGLHATKVVRLPIGSNVPLVTLSPSQRVRIRSALGWQSNDAVAVTFGSMASQARALRNCSLCLARGIKSGRLQRVVGIGGQPGEAAPNLDFLPAILRRPGVLTFLGHQHEHRVAEMLQACDFALSSYPYALLGKSTAVAAYAAAGLPIFVSHTDKTEVADSVELPIISAESFDWNQANSGQIEHLRECGPEYAAVNLRWPVIALRALATLRVETARSIPVPSGATK